MTQQKRIALQLSLLTILIYLSSCAIVTVNIYFPAEEVKGAFKSLEEELLETPQQTPKKPEAKPQGKPQSLKYPDKPQVESRRIITLKRKLSFNFTPVSWAAEYSAEQIAAEVRKMPEVMQAFNSRKQHLNEVNALLTSGAVGEGKNGLLAKRGTIAPADMAIVNAENAARNVIVRGMAAAIVKITKLDPTPANIDSLIPQAAEQFAATRRDGAQAGWDIQLPNGQWTKK